MIPELVGLRVILASLFVGLCSWVCCSRNRPQFIFSVPGTRCNKHYKHATLSWGTELIKVSSTGPSSTLPSFFFMADDEEGGNLYKSRNYTGGRGTLKPFHVKTTCPDDVFEHTSDDLRVPQLPWRLQQDWGCELKLQNVSMLVLENDYLRAKIAPQWGGKIWSLFDKKRKRELFFKNPSHQPANIGYRKAWTSGGCEWNWSPGHIGHSVFTEAPVWTAMVETEVGPLLRVFEYDRQNSTVWQVDMLLVDDLFLVHPKITNPSDHDLQGYWWTCVAMPVDGPLNRILSPAHVSMSNQGQCTPWPWGAFTLPNTSFHGPNINYNNQNCADSNTCAWQNDLSFLGNIPVTNDFFFHIPKNQTPWIAQVQQDGFTVVHSHPDFLNGTKFFQWGWHEQGTYNQDFLSGTNTTCATHPDVYDPNCMDSGHPGLYTELQIGPARSQMHTFPLPAQSVLEWTEWFKAFQGNPQEMQNPDYSVPLAIVETWRNGPNGVSETQLADLDTLLHRMADVPPTQMLHQGMPWGGLYQALRKVLGHNDDAIPACPFPKPEVTVETKPWLELLETGTFSDETLAVVPVNFEVSDGWIHLLQIAIDAGRKETWLHWLFLGTHALETGNARGAKRMLERSMELQPSVHAARNMALLAPTVDQVVLWYRRAWSLWNELDLEVDPSVGQLGSDLAGEFCGWLVGNEQWEDLQAFLDLLRQTTSAQAFLSSDRILHAQAAVAVHLTGDHDKAIVILRSHCFPTYGSLRKNLLALWWTAQKMKAIAAKGGIPLTTAEMLSLRKTIRCDGDQTHLGLDDPCVCGPPNLGYAYH